MDDDILRVVENNKDIYELKKLVNVYEFYLSAFSEPVKVTVEIYHASDMTNPYQFSLSHYVRTPLQAGPYVPSAPYYASEAIALSQAIEAITSFIKAAVREGHEPRAEWLVPRSA